MLCAGLPTPHFRAGLLRMTETCGRWRGTGRETVPQRGGRSTLFPGSAWEQTARRLSLQVTNDRAIAMRKIIATTAAVLVSLASAGSSARAMQPFKKEFEKQYPALAPQIQTAGCF